MLFKFILTIKPLHLDLTKRHSMLSGHSDLTMTMDDEEPIRTRTSGEGVVLEIRTHPDKGRGGLKIRDFGGRPL